MEIRFSIKFARTTLKILLLIALILCSASFASEVYALFNGQHVEVLGANLGDGINFFDVNKEANIPNWFSSSILLLCSILLGVITSNARRAGDRYSLYWGILSIVLVLMSVDEAAASLHNKLGGPLQSVLDTGGLFYYNWVILGGGVVVIFGLVYMRFVLDLPVTIRRLFVAAGALYVAGSLGLEMITGLVSDLRGDENLPYIALLTVEELLEMSGATIFLHALIRYITCLQEWMGVKP
jgi:hypothetical protein